MKIKPSITVIILTYSDRRDLLLKVVHYLVRESLFKIILVLNGTTCDKDFLKLNNNDSNIDIVDLKYNFGPAIGYSEGIKHAVSIGSKFILLLDDDNLPHANTISILVQKYNYYYAKFQNHALALSSARPIYQGSSNAYDEYSLAPMHSCFMGFHIFHMIYKIKSIFKMNVNFANKNTNDLTILTAPYGGLFFHTDLIDIIGYPRSDFIIYADDSEWTYRIIENGGKIYLIKDAIINDLDCSWDTTVQYTFYIWLEGLSDIKAYYRMRNCVYFFKYKYMKNKILYKINKYIYLSSLFIVSILKNKFRRFLLLREAIINGENGRMGIFKNFHL